MYRQTRLLINCSFTTYAVFYMLRPLPATSLLLGNPASYNELNRLHQCGVKTWVTKACELAEQYQVDISSNIQNFKNIVRWRFQTVTNTAGYWRLRILTETQSCEHIQCSKQNSVSRHILKPYLTVATVYSHDQMTLQFAYIGRWMREIYKT